MVAACRQPGISVAAVALANGLNANLLHRWIAAHEQSATAAPHVPALAEPTQDGPPAGFVPVALAPKTETDQPIRIELRRGAITVTIAWPASAAADCAAWVRELLR